MFYFLLTRIEIMLRAGGKLYRVFFVLRGQYLISRTVFPKPEQECRPEAFLRSRRNDCMDVCMRSQDDFFYTGNRGKHLQGIAFISTARVQFHNLNLMRHLLWGPKE